MILSMSHKEWMPCGFFMRSSLHTGMSLETIIYDEIKTLCDGKVYPTIPSENCQIPFAIYSIVETLPVVHCQGATSLNNVKVAIDVVAQNLDDVLSILNDFKAALHCLNTADIQGSFLVGQQTQPEESYHHGIQNYNMWINN